MILLLFHHPSPGDFFFHSPLQDITQFLISNCDETFFDHFFIPGFQCRHFVCDENPIPFCRGRNGDFADGEKNILDRISLVQMVEFLEDILLHEMELLHPDGVCDLDKKDRLPYAVRARMGGDPGADGLKPDGPEAPILHFQGNVIFLQYFMQDVVDPLQFG